MSLQVAQFLSFLIFHCIYVLHLLYLFLCWWTFRLCPCPGYCKQYCGKHWGAYIELLGKHTDWNHPPWPGTIVTICMSCFMTGGPGKQHGTNKPPPTGRVWERSTGDTTCPTTSQNPFLWHPSWLNKASTTRKDSESEWLAKDNLETNPFTIKPETASQVAELFSWVPLPSCSPPGCPFQIKSLALSAHVSPRTIHFRVLDKSPVSGPGRGPRSCNIFICIWYISPSFCIFSPILQHKLRQGHK